MDKTQTGSGPRTKQICFMSSSPLVVLIVASVSVVFLSAIEPGYCELDGRKWPQSHLADQVHQSAIRSSLRWFELKFQQSPEPITYTKQEEQQQILKCHVKLAPISSQKKSNNNNQYQPSHNETGQEIMDRKKAIGFRSKDESANLHLKAEVSSIDLPSLEDELARLISTSFLDAAGADKTTGSGEPNLVQLVRWPWNVTMSIDWLRNNQSLSDWLAAESSQDASGQLAIINGEHLNGNHNDRNHNNHQAAHHHHNHHHQQQQLQQQQQQNPFGASFSLDQSQNITPIGMGPNDQRVGWQINNQPGDSIKRVRVEVKNTLNRHQLKLSSRLRINQVRAKDTGHFKCIARANFTLLSSEKIPLPSRGESTASNSNDNSQPEASLTMQTKDNSQYSSSNNNNNYNYNKMPSNPYSASLTGRAGPSGNRADEDGARGGGGLRLVRIKQSLESNEAILVVSPKGIRNKMSNNKIKHSNGPTNGTTPTTSHGNTTNNIGSPIQANGHQASNPPGSYDSNHQGSRKANESLDLLQHQHQHHNQRKPEAGDSRLDKSNDALSVGKATVKIDANPGVSLATPARASEPNQDLTRARVDQEAGPLSGLFRFFAGSPKDQPKQLEGPSRQRTQLSATLGDHKTPGRGQSSSTNELNQLNEIGPPNSGVNVIGDFPEPQLDQTNNKQQQHHHHHHHHQDDDQWLTGSNQVGNKPTRTRHPLDTDHDVVPSISGQEGNGQIENTMHRKLNTFNWNSARKHWSSQAESDEPNQRPLMTNKIPPDGSHSRGDNSTAGLEIGIGLNSAENQEDSIRSLNDFGWNSNDQTRAVPEAGWFIQWPGALLIPALKPDQMGTNGLPPDSEGARMTTLPGGDNKSSLLGTSSLSPSPSPSGPMNSFVVIGRSQNRNRNHHHLEPSQKMDLESDRLPATEDERPKINELDKARENNISGLIESPTATGTTTTSTTGTTWKQLIQITQSPEIHDLSVADSDSVEFHFVRFLHSRVLGRDSLTGCYTGLGEHYAGNVSESTDGRSCVHWAHLTQWMNLPMPAGNPRHGQFRHHQTQSSANQDGLNPQHLVHNHCRNPDSNPRGPWCYVRYSEQLDGAARHLPGLTSQNWPPIDHHNEDSDLDEDNSSSNQVVGENSYSLPTNMDAMIYVVKECNISPCSRYLWLYIVAPPIGLLCFLLVAFVMSIRSMRRRSQYKKCLGHMVKVVLPNRCHKIGVSQRGYTNASTTKRHHIDGLEYTDQAPSDNDSQPIDRDNEPLDWRNLQSLSPKSGDTMQLTESPSSSLHSDCSQPTLRDNSASSGRQLISSKAGNSSSYQRSKSHMQFQSRKAANITKGSLISNEKLLDLSSSTSDFSCSSTSHHHPRGPNTHQIQFQHRFQESGQGHMNNKRESGPIFATLRCHLRKPMTGNKNSNNVSATNESFNDPIYATGYRNRPIKAIASKQDNETGAYQNVVSAGFKVDNRQNQLMPCLATLDDIEPITVDEAEVDFINKDDAIEVSKLTKAAHLARLDSSSILIDTNSESLFEGKFSHVQIGHWKRSVTGPMGDQDSAGNVQAASRDIGLAVGVQSLKIHSTGSFLVDNKSPFHPDILNVRNLNHLNLIKLIGCKLDPCSTDVNKNQLIEEHSACALIYDMSHLVDFTDWLKQQNCNLLAGNEGDIQLLSLRRNLTCLAKQIALAMDYLHDQDIIYKDLACRNCFIDPTKMIVKLATFNHEIVLASGDNQDLTRKTETMQTLVNSQAKQNSELKSMIRPKYLLDYYVIDSRPSDSQMLPLSWIPLESILFNKFNKQTDIWSFGCLLYELFTLGEVAYFGYSCKQIIDSVRANLMPAQPRLCPNGIYRLMCNCLSDIPTIRPNVKQIYEQLNLFSGQCTSFLDHHLCSLE